MLVVSVSGGAAIDQQAGFADVRATVESRSGKRIVWSRGTALDAHVAKEGQTLRGSTLTAEGATQVALLNNRALQALYTDLGAAQADLVQEGLLNNPMFDGTALFPFSGAPVTLELHAALSFLDIFYLPLRQRIAQARFADAKLHVTASCWTSPGRAGILCPGRTDSRHGSYPARAGADGLLGVCVICV
ncbi:MAG: hypothetical protein AB7N91_29260 [Candidatus Tectimicrobiota bacterium]